MSIFRLRCLDQVSPDRGDKVATDPAVSPPVAGDKWRQTPDLSPLSPLSPSPAGENVSDCASEGLVVAVCRRPDRSKTLRGPEAGDTATVATDPRLRDPNFRRRIVAARNAAPLTHFREALLLSKLVICANCSHFTFGADPADLGQCSRWNAEAFPFVPFFCTGFDLSKTPTAPAFAPEPGGAQALERPAHSQETPK